MTASTNYAGRTVDVLILQDVQAAGEVQVEMSLGDAGSVCTGIQKAIQTFVLLFLTDKGSVVDEEERGTDFLQSLRVGAIRDEATLEAQFRFAVMDVLNYDAESRAETDPDDEVLENAELVSFTLQPGFLSMQVRLTTLAGESRTIILPVETVIK